MRYLPQYRNTKQAIESIRLLAPTGERVSLAQLCKIKEQDGGSEIYREGNQRYVAIKYSVRGRDLDRVILVGKIDRHTEQHELGGRQYGASEKDGETIQTQDDSSAHRFGTVEKPSIEFARGTQFASILPPRDRRVYRLVLLGATIGIQPFCCPTV